MISGRQEEGQKAPCSAISEGDLVRSTNALYKPYGVGRVQKVRNGMAKIEFNPSVFMEPPYGSENKSHLRLKSTGR